MATGNITGKTNIPIKLYEYTGKNTSTAETIVDNDKKEISVNVNVEEVTKDCASKEELESLKPLVGGMIKSGEYILDDERTNYILVEEVPSDYSGPCINIGDDGLMYIESFTDGEISSTVEISVDGVDTVNPRALRGLTHSFNELDPVLKQIVDDAIQAGTEGSGVACTLAQWNAIKQLLDMSLYINYEGNSMIKTFTNEINWYIFGCSLYGTPIDTAIALEIRYYDNESLLFIIDGTY